MTDLNIDDCINKICPWSGKPVQADSLALYGDSGRPCLNRGGHWRNSPLSLKPRRVSVGEIIQDRYCKVIESTYQQVQIQWNS